MIGCDFIHSTLVRLLSTSVKWARRTLRPIKTTTKNKKQRVDISIIITIIIIPPLL